MQPQNQQINSIIEPNAIPFSFDAPGWTVVGIVLLLTLLFILIKIYISYRKNTYRRLAIIHLNAIGHKDELSLQQKAMAINTCIKQVAILKYKREQTALLDGLEWYTFLNTKMKKSVFTKDIFSIIQEGLYNETVLSNDGINQFINESKTWINKHVV